MVLPKTRRRKMPDLGLLHEAADIEDGERRQDADP
jgi:hypothetical protein